MQISLWMFLSNVKDYLQKVKILKIINFSVCGRNRRAFAILDRFCLKIYFDNC